MQLTSLTGSPVEKVTFRNRSFYIKRDDLLHESFAGNKARKFYYFLKNDFPGINKLISYGSPQANSLYSFSALAKLKGWDFDFYVNHIPGFMKQHPKGNYQAALANGANIIEIKSELERTPDLGLPEDAIASYIRQQILPAQPQAVFVPEGGRCQEAATGVELLADEIIMWAKGHKINKLMVALPSGTGTTALFLQQQFLQQRCDIEVVTCACVGGDEYLKKQFFELSADQSVHPTILPMHKKPGHKKYHFGKLYDEFFEIWQELTLATGIEFELLYDPLGWLSLLEHLETQEKNQDLAVLYIHQGGLLGNETMLPRYQRQVKAKKTNQPR